jgi:hypothetical protein
MREGLFLILSLFYAIMIIEGSSATVLIKPSSISFPDLPAKSGTFPSLLFKIEAQNHDLFLPFLLIN